MPLLSGRLSTRTNLKAVGGGTGRHRGNGKPEPVDAVVEDKELTSYLAALAPDSDKESTGTGKRFGEAQVFQLRMNLIAGQQLKDCAEERGITPQALAMEWVLERLSWESQAASAQDRLQAEALTQEFSFPEGAFDR